MKTPVAIAEEAIRLYFEEGWSQRQVADHLSLGKGTVQGIVEGLIYPELARPPRKTIPRVVRNEYGQFERAL
jgi:hypothetical protein